MKADHLDLTIAQVQPGSKVLLVGSFANTSGAPMALLRVADGLRSRGHDTSVCFMYAKSGENELAGTYDVLVPAKKPGLMDYGQMVKNLVVVCRRERPDVVISFLPLANLVGQLAAAASGTTKRIASHRVPVGTYSRFMQASDWLMAAIGGYSDVVAVSDAVRQSCANYPSSLRQRIRVVHNGLAWQPSSLSRQAARDQFDLPADAKLLLAVGRLHEQKNYPYLLSVLRGVDDVMLAIAGDGDLGPQLEAIVDDYGLTHRVRFLGNVARSDIPDLLRAADVFVQPSLFEGQSNSLIEALHEGLPVLASDIPEQREALTDENGSVAGHLLPLNDPQAWHEPISSLFEEEVHRKARAASLARAEYFAVDRMIDGFEAALR